MRWRSGGGVAAGRGLAVLAATAWLAGAGGAVGAPAWGPVQTFDPEPSIEAWAGQPQEIGSPPALGVDDAGRATAVWATTTGPLYEGIPLTATVRTADRAPGGGWTAPQVLDAVASEWGEPDVAVNGRGDAVAAWETRAGGIHAATRRAGGAWSAPAPLAAQGSAPRVALDRNGQAHVAWTTATGVQAATRATEGAWAVQTLPAAAVPEYAVRSLALAVDPSGTATLAWTATDAVEVAQWRLSSGWVPRATYPETAPAGLAAAASNGRVVVAWRNGRAEGALLRSATGNASGGWGTASTIATEPYDDWGPGGPRPDPQVALDATGAVTVLWTGIAEAGYPYNRLRWSARAAGAVTWTAPAVLEGTIEEGFWAVSPAAVGVDASGTVHAVWVYLGQIRVARRPRGGAWGPVRVVNGAEAPDRNTTAPSLVVTPGGSAVAAWQRVAGFTGHDRAVLYRHDAAAYEERNTAPAEATDAQFWGREATGATRRLLSAPHVWSGTVLTGRATFTDPDGGPLTVEAQWRAADGAYADAQVVRTAVAGPGTREFALPDLPPGRYVVRFRAVDAQGAAGPWHPLLDGDPDWTVVPATAPVLTRLLPSAVVRGAGDTDLYVDADGITAGTAIQVDGVSLPTRAVSAGRLAATVPGAMLRQAGGLPVRVVTDVLGATATQRTSAPLDLEVRTGLVAPQNVTPPQLGGTPAVGGTLVCGAGVWTGAPETLAFAWLRDGAVVATGAAARTVGAEDAGHAIACRVTAGNGAGVAEATSVAVDIPIPAPPGGPGPGTGGGTGTGPVVTPTGTPGTTVRQPARARVTASRAVLRRGGAVTLRLRFDRPARRLLVQVQMLRGGGFVPVRTLRVSGATPRVTVRISERGAHRLRVVWVGPGGVRHSPAVRVWVR
jgi:hypothetical protein